MTNSNWDFSDFVARPTGPGPEQDQPRPSDPGTPRPSDPNTFLPRVDYGFPVQATGSMAFAEPGRPPVAWLLASIVLVIAAGVLAAFWGETPRWAVTAWVASGPIAIGLLAAFTAFDTRARAKSLYSTAGWVKPAYILCIVLGGVAVCLSAVRIAFWLGRL